MSTPSLSPSIIELRLSFIWTEIFETLPSKKSRMGFLVNEHQYVSRYEALRKAANVWANEVAALRASEQSDPQTFASKKQALTEINQTQVAQLGGIMLPWPLLERRHTHNFWKHYLRTPPNNFIGKDAWEYVVPFRTSILVRHKSPWPTVMTLNSQADGFIYPHGVAVVVTLRLIFKNDIEGAQAVGLGLRQTTNYALSVRRDNIPVAALNQPEDRLKLDILAEQLLDNLRERVLGSDKPQGIRPSPLSVATIIQGRNADPKVEIKTDQDLHLVLEGLCSWDNDWADEKKLQPLKKANLLIGESQPGRMVYHFKRGRAVWLPDLFAIGGDPGMRKLGCYHRNLSLLSLHTEMLAQLDDTRR